MTREEKIAELINIRDNFNYTLAPREVFDDAIKALEQEPTYVSELTQKAYEDGKKDGYVQAKIEQDSIIDKIRAEIEEMPTYYREIIRNSATSLKMVILDEVIQILDKYKAESEKA